MKKLLAFLFSAMLVCALPGIALANYPSNVQHVDSGTTAGGESLQATVHGVQGKVEITPDSTPAQNVPSDANVLASFQISSDNAADVSTGGASLTFTLPKVANKQVMLYIYQGDASGLSTLVSIPNQAGPTVVGPLDVDADGNIILTAENGITLPATFSVVEYSATTPPNNPSTPNTPSGSTTPNNPGVTVRPMTPDSYYSNATTAGYSSESSDNSGWLVTTGSQASGQNASSVSPQTGVDFSGVIALSVVALGIAGCAAFALRKKLTE